MKIFRKSKRSLRGLAVRAAAAVTASAVLFVSGGCVFLPDEEEVLAPPAVREANISYSTVIAKRKDLVKQVVYTGIVRSQTTYDLCFTSHGGTIAKIYVRTGDKVKKGDIICELDTSDISYSAQEAELRLKKAELDKKVLAEKGASQAEIDRAQVEIDLIQMEVDALNEKREESKLYAPADGTVSALGNGISAGNYVDAGASVATLIDTSKLYIAISPGSSSEYTLYDMGTKLSIVIGEQSYDAEVFMIPEEVVADGYEEEVEYDVYDPDKTDDELSPEELVFDREHVYIRFTETPPDGCVGNLADTVLVLDERKDVIVISNNLIKKIGDSNVVYMIKDGKKVAKEVEVGLQTASSSEIISGIEEGDEIIVR